MGIALQDELRLEKLRERLIDRPNDVSSTVQLGEIIHLLEHASAKLLRNRLTVLNILERTQLTIEECTQPRQTDGQRRSTDVILEVQHYCQVWMWVSDAAAHVW